MITPKSLKQTLKTRNFNIIETGSDNEVGITGERDGAIYFDFETGELFDLDTGVFLGTVHTDPCDIINQYLAADEIDNYDPSPRY